MKSLLSISRGASSHSSAVSEWRPHWNVTGLLWIKRSPPSDLYSTSSSSEALYATPPTWTKTAGVLEDAYTVCVPRPYSLALVMSALCFLPSSGQKVTHVQLYKAVSYAKHLILCTVFSVSKEITASIKTKVQLKSNKGMNQKLPLGLKKMFAQNILSIMFEKPVKL